MTIFYFPVVNFNFSLICILMWFTFQALRPWLDLIAPTQALQSLHIATNWETARLAQRRNVTSYKGHETSAFL